MGSKMGSKIGSKMGSKMGSNRVPKVAIPFEREAKIRKSAGPPTELQPVLAREREARLL